MKSHTSDVRTCVRCHESFADPSAFDPIPEEGDCSTFLSLIGIRPAASDQMIHRKVRPEKIAFGKLAGRFLVERELLPPDPIAVCYPLAIPRSRKSSDQAGRMKDFRKSSAFGFGGISRSRDSTNRTLPRRARNCSSPQIRTPWRRGCGGKACDLLARIFGGLQPLRLHGLGAQQKAGHDRGRYTAPHGVRHAGHAGFIGWRTDDASDG